MKAAGRRRKGSAFERAVVALHRELGTPAERVPLSGAAGGSYTGDVKIGPLGSEKATFTAECKARGKGGGFKLIERWLGGKHLLYLKRDRQPPLVVMDARLWALTVQRAYGAPLLEDEDDCQR